MNYLLKCGVWLTTFYVASKKNQFWIVQETSGV